MSQIHVNNLTFAYDGSYDTIFENTSFVLDTDWKLGFIGRNGRGKTTFFHLLLGHYAYQGSISADVRFTLFPFAAEDETRSTLQTVRAAIAPFDQWEAELERLAQSGEAGLAAYGEIQQRYEYVGGYVINELIEREAARLGMEGGVLSRPFHTLSGGEKPKCCWRRCS